MLKSFKAVLLIGLCILGTGCDKEAYRYENSIEKCISDYLDSNGIDGSPMYWDNENVRDEIYVYISSESEENIGKLNAEVISGLIEFINTNVLCGNDLACCIEIEGRERCDIPTHEYIDIKNYMSNKSNCSRKLSYMNGDLNMIVQMSDSEIKEIEYLTINVIETAQYPEPIEPNDFLLNYTELKKFYLVGHETDKVALSQDFISDLKEKLPPDCTIVI